MAKIIIPFNDKNYSVDESALSTASAALKSYLSTVMSGSGATINFDGVSYGIDSTKLQTATNAFISHLATIAGSGKKVVVNGVEYNIGSDKVAGAIADLEAVLGDLHSDDGIGNEPTKNQYGFYYNKPYYRDEGDYNNAYVFYEDGTFVYFNPYPEYFGGSEPYFCDGSGFYEVIGSVIIIDWGDEFTFAADGSSFEVNSPRWPERNGTYVASGTEHGVYYGDTYYAPADSDFESITFHEDGTATIVAGGETTVVQGVSTYDHGHYLSDWVSEDLPYTFDALITIDGNECIFYREYSPDGIVLTRGEPAPIRLTVNSPNSSDPDYPSSTTAVTGYVSAVAGIDNITVTVGSDEYVIPAAEIEADGTFWVTLDIENFQLYEVVITATDNIGNTMVQTRYVCLYPVE